MAQRRPGCAKKQARERRRPGHRSTYRGELDRHMCCSRIWSGQRIARKSGRSRGPRRANHCMRRLGFRIRRCQRESETRRWSPSQHRAFEPARRFDAGTLGSRRSGREGDREHRRSTPADLPAAAARMRLTLLAAPARRATRAVAASRILATPTTTATRDQVRHGGGAIGTGEDRDRLSKSRSAVVQLIASSRGHRAASGPGRFCLCAQCPR